MEVPNSEHGHMIEIHGESPDANRGISGSKICGGAACGFSDANTSSKDAKERSQSMRKLLIAVVLCVIFMSVEVAGGIKANSLAILTDAAHLLSDVAAFAISLFSLWAAGWEATPRQSYGFFRIEILGALISIQMIWLLAGILVYEAIARLIHDTGEVQGFLMFIVSAFGLVVNIVMALLLGHEHGHGHGHGHGHNDHGVHSHGHDDGAGDHDHMHKHSDENHHTYDIHITEPLLKSGSEVENRAKEKKSRNINVQGAYLHVLGDSIQSVGVMVGGAIIWYKPEWKIVDLICTLVFSVIVLGTTIRMLRSILEVLMESTPREIDATKIEKGLCEMDEVVAIHELHIWAITVGKILLACHVMIKPDADADMVLEKIRLGNLSSFEMFVSLLFFCTFPADAQELGVPGNCDNDHWWTVIHPIQPSSSSSFRIVGAIQSPRIRRCGTKCLGSCGGLARDRSQCVVASSAWAWGRGSDEEPPSLNFPPPFSRGCLIVGSVANGVGGAGPVLLGRAWTRRGAAVVETRSRCQK
ncbi:Metal tolerance protein 1 [Turnera subulata]|uniref:Metal tolerance protein 1 n=1 Tax=Turnera subulata TaxID=218843 RepID=A0A9Q0GKG2_9ROSI|nr:Metal tolerance protein 1 [Turnera subulata]